MDIIPLKYCYLTKKQLEDIVLSVGNRADRKKTGTKWRLIWGFPPRYKFQNRELDSKIMSGDDAQAIANHIAEQTVLFRRDIEKYILSIDNKISANITLNIDLQIYRGPRAEQCTDFDYPLSGNRPIGRP